MTKRVFIIHCLAGSPEMFWYPWLKIQLENKGFEVNILKMPNPEEPKIKSWVNFLKKKY